MLAKLDRLDEAERAFRRALDIDDLPALRRHLGELYEKMGKKAEALRQYREGWKLVEEKPKDPHHEWFRDALKRLGD